MRVAASAFACLIAAFAVMSAIVVAGSVMRDVAVARPSASAAGAGARVAAPFSSDVVRRLDALIAKFPASAAVWIADPASAVPLYAHDADAKVTTASLYKLGVLMEAERRVDSGQMRYSDSITIGPDDVTDEGSAYEPGTVLSLDDALEAMITVSDNGAALALWHLFGGSAIEASLVRDGLPDLLTFDVDGNTLTTPRATGTFFQLLARKQLVSPAASDRMLARLEGQTLNDRLPALLPKQTVVAHKTGNLAGLTHDAGIIFTPGGPRVVVVMTWDGFEGANTFIADVAAIVYAASPAGASTP
jgi:beta-lactamase class A